jgi:hypothetical protein
VEITIITVSAIPGITRMMDTNIIVRKL